MKPLSLFELNNIVRETIELSLNDSYWVEAEVAEAREHGGHCYLELIEKDADTNTPVARASARCWRSAWLLLRPRFERVTGQRLAAGMKLLLNVRPQFHEQYGFAWIVNDIDPTFTLGDMARKRQEIINKLKAEGVFDLNRELKLPLLTQRIAVISSRTAAGYGDFVNQLIANDYNLRFDVELFEAIMQGEQVEESIIIALEQIYQRIDDFDCVVIIRGGGATADLSGFDTLLLAENVANFPLPIITGIGHERDECVLDLIAHTRMKTPTAVAAFLIDRMARILATIDRLANTITHATEQRLSIEKLRLDRLATLIPHLFATIRVRKENELERLYRTIVTLTQQHLAEEKNNIKMQEQRLTTLAAQRLQNEKHRITLLAQRIELLNPERLLQKGYSITLKNGMPVTSADRLNEGDIITTRLAKGEVSSIVTTTSDNKTTAK